MEPARENDLAHFPTAIETTGRPQAVGRQLERRHTGELPAPPVDPARQGLAREPAPLPDREVGILDRQLRERRGAAGGESRVERRDFADEETGRPTVGDDVMQAQEKDVLVLFLPQEESPEERPAREVEGLPGGSGEQLPDGGFPRCEAVEVTEIDDGERAQLCQPCQLCQSRDHLDRPLRTRPEGGAERLVAADDLAQARLQGRQVEAPGEDQAGGHVVGGAPRLQLIEEPEPLLGEGERQLRSFGRPRHGPQRWGPGSRTAGDDRHQPAHGRLREERPQRYLHPERLAQARHHPGGEQRVAAESEKVLRNPDSLAAEHLPPDPRHDLLGRGPRCHIPGLFRSDFGYEVGEGSPIDLAVRRQRQPFEDDERPRHHVLRQEPPQGRPQLRRCH